MDFCGHSVCFLSTQRTLADDYGRARSSRGFESHLLRQSSELASFLDSKIPPDVFISNVDSKTWKASCFLSLLSFVETHMVVHLHCDRARDISPHCSSFTSHS